jgi:hypothetical protein
MALPSIWYGTQAFVSIQRLGDAAPVNFSSKITKFDIGGGDRQTEDIYTFGNNTTTKQLRADPLEVSISGLATDTLFRQMWAGGTPDTTEATNAGILVSGTASTRDLYRIILLVKDGVTDALFAGTTYDYGVAICLGPCLRYTFTDAYAVSVSESLEADGNFEVDVSFKIQASNMQVESASTTTYGISALSTASYT